MTRRDEGRQAAAPRDPVLFVVDADPQALARTASAVIRRYGLDDEVRSADSARAGLTALEQLARGDGTVAPVAADLHLPEMDGVEFLERVHALHRDASRVLLVVRDVGIGAGRLPAVIHSTGSVLHDPTLSEIAGSHGIATRPTSEVYDRAILGAGPAGLAVAVYGASEGLRTLIVEPEAIGGQAGTSSMIRNYLGFPRGLTGAELTHRAGGASPALPGRVRVHTPRDPADRARREPHRRSGRRKG